MTNQKESDLRVITLEQGTATYQEIVNKATDSDMVIDLIKIRTDEGFVVDTKDAEVKVAENKGTGTRALEKVAFLTYLGDDKVGEVGFVNGLEGNKQTIVYSQVVENDEISIYYFEDGQLQHHTFTQAEQDEFRRWLQRLSVTKP
ncbi:hypothetical protein [Oceanobacillus iheyensis HTE831]|uniref:Uncharacterized protein n=1 Tax=Oceanobacillus iheyensis (strain DSM 14371 / CIP 107618 / JCM 11309 / KCTC 3954 / HTE831) TaxID=221109 RepID=Q8ETU1_OCEIH|nr:hypothetical protein [Oceanobacillus iheyensis]BAC12120.1 hypothetical protein [Oceanobacillus iheyensis HTE831]